MKVTLIPVAAAAIVATASTGADAAAVEPRLFGISWGSSVNSWSSSLFPNGCSGSTKNSWANYAFSTLGSYKSSLASKTYYNAGTAPWKSGSAPGWCYGFSVSGLTTWDGGDNKWCRYWPYSSTAFCTGGNSKKGTKPSSSQNPNPWGSNGNDPHRPCPNKPGKSSSTTATTATQTSTATSSTATSSSTSSTSTATSTDVSTSTDAPTSTATSTSSTDAGTTSTTSTSTSSAPVVPETGAPVSGCTDGYSVVFNNYTTVATSGVYQGQVVGAAIVDNANYLTYGLSTTPEGCLTVCDGVAGCAFVNSYLAQYPDGETPTDLPASAAAQYDGRYTCSLYSICEGTSAATNYGGQNDPSYITNSKGWCKSC